MFLVLIIEAHVPVDCEDDAHGEEGAGAPVMELFL